MRSCAAVSMTRGVARRYSHEVALGELFHMCGFMASSMVVGRECAHSPGVGMPSRLHDIVAGEEARSGGDLSA